MLMLSISKNVYLRGLARLPTAVASRISPVYASRDCSPLKSRFANRPVVAHKKSKVRTLITAENESGLCPN